MSNKVTKKITHDAMKLKCVFPSGGYFQISITRNGVRKTVAFSNNDVLLKEQSRIFNNWTELRSDETYGQLFERIEEMILNCNSGQEFINKIKTISL